MQRGRVPFFLLCPRVGHVTHLGVRADRNAIGDWGKSIGYYANCRPMKLVEQYDAADAKPGSAPNCLWCAAGVEDTR